MTKPSERISKLWEASDISKADAVIAYLDEQAARPHAWCAECGESAGCAENCPTRADEGVPLSTESNALVNALMALCGNRYDFDGERYYCKLPAGHDGPHTDEAPKPPTALSELRAVPGATTGNGEPRCANGHDSELRNVRERCGHSETVERDAECERCEESPCACGDPAPDEDEWLAAIGDAIDNDLGWDNDEDRERGDYPGRIRQVAQELRGWRAERDQLCAERDEARAALARVEGERGECQEQNNNLLQAYRFSEQAKRNSRAELAKVTADRDTLQADLHRANERTEDYIRVLQAEKDRVAFVEGERDELKASELALLGECREIGAQRDALKAELADPAPPVSEAT